MSHNAHAYTPLIRSYLPHAERRKRRRTLKSFSLNSLNSITNTHRPHGVGRLTCLRAQLLVTCGCCSRCHKDQRPCDQRLSDQLRGRGNSQHSVSTTTPGRCHTSSSGSSRTISVYRHPPSLSSSFSIRRFPL